MWLYVPLEFCPSAAESAGLILASGKPPAMPPKLSATLNGKPFALTSWRRAWVKDSMTRLYGAILNPSMAAHGVDKWIASLAATRASRFQQLGVDWVPTTPDTCGPTSCELSRQLSLPYASLRTSQATLPWGLNKSAKTFKDWVTALRRAYSARQSAAPFTSESASSFLPTPTAGGHHSYSACPRKRIKFRLSLIGMAKTGLWPTPLASNSKGGTLKRVGRAKGCSLSDKVLMWPTRQAHDAQKGYAERVARASSKAGCRDLNDSVQLWPTSTTLTGGCDVPEGSRWVGKTTAYNPQGRKVSVGLHTAVRQWPTPTVKGNYNQAGLSDKSGDGLATAVQAAQPADVQRAQLSAGWVELLMGLPLNWTNNSVGVRIGKKVCLESPLESAFEPTVCEL